MKRRLPAMALFGLALFSVVSAQEDPIRAESYIQPNDIIRRAILAPWHENVSVGGIHEGSGRWMTIRTGGPVKLADLGQPWMNIAGLQFDPARNRSRTLTSRVNAGLIVGSLTAPAKGELKMPAGVSPSGAAWSPDGRWIAFVGSENSGSYVYVADSISLTVRRVSSRPLNAVLTSNLEWSDDGRRIAAVLIPTVRPERGSMAPVAGSPKVNVTNDRRDSLRVFADLLQSESEAKDLVHFTMGQLAVIDVATGQVTEVGKPSMIQSFNAQPNLQFFRVTNMERPFSYIQPISSYPSRTILIDSAGKEIEVLQRPVPTGGPGAGNLRPAGAAGQAPATPPGRRSLSWHPNGLGLTYLQKKDGADQITLWKAPFGKDDVEVLYSSKADINSFIFLPDFNRAIITQSISGETVTSLVTMKSDAEPKKLISSKPADIYANPGTVSTMPGRLTGRVVRTDGSYLFLEGTQYSKDPMKEAPRPFLDRVSLSDGKVERIWQSSAERYENPTLIDSTVEKILVNRQSPTEVPNDFLVNLKDKSSVALTTNIDYTPDASGLREERIEITRVDGFKFWATVTLPKFFLDGEGRKSFFWFYPNEERSQTSYDESRRLINRNTFRRVSVASPKNMALLGWVVVEPDCPIVGTAERPNDTYIPQLRNNLTATIDTLERARLIDRRYLAIGGHSYGAFSTAHAMIQTPYFKAGIAGDGNYNRTMTPFGFQAEPRTLWEGRDVYAEMSPLVWADRLSGALLMYHGQEDQNVGTALINSERMYAALEALGKPASLYVYPYEDHGQVAIESRLDMWARWIAWLEKYVK